MLDERDMTTPPIITRRTFVAAGALGATAGLAACAGKTGATGGTGTVRSPSRLAIVHTNDTHGHDQLDQESLGMASVAKLKEQLQEEGFEVLLLDSGDAVQGTNVVNLSRGDRAMEFMNAAGYDAMALGNHEFDFGLERLEGYVAAATFPLLAANVVVKDSGETLVDAHTIFTLEDGRKVGVFGLTTPESSTKANPVFVSGLHFMQEDELYACAQREVDELREQGCELVVCVAHLGELDAGAPNRACDVVAHVAGIDLLINGHDHKEEEQVLEDASGAGTLVVEAGCFTHLAGVVTWREDGALEHRFVRYGEMDAQDEEVAALVREAVDETDEILAEVVATTPFRLNGDYVPGLRTEETNLGDLVADAILWEAQLVAEDTPDIALANGGSIRASIPEGDITFASILEVVPFINDVSTVHVTGRELLEALEVSCSVTPKSLGGFPQVAGISFTIDTSVPFEEGPLYEESVYNAPANPGARVRIDEINGEPFDEDASYVLATTDFICAGGDTYHAFVEASRTSMKGCSVTLYETLLAFLTDACGGEVPGEYEQTSGRITVL